MQAATSATDRCPRCGGAFHCGSADAGPCACVGITLDATTQAELRRRYTSCLCLRCLRELGAPSVRTAGVGGTGA